MGGRHFRNLHSVGVLGLANVEFEVLEVREELLLNVLRGTLLESGNSVGTGTLLLKSILDRLHVT